MFNIAKLARAAEREAELYNKIEQLQAQLKAMQLEKADDIKKDVNGSSFEIDWTNMDVFSVERMGDKNSAYTVIGHWIDGQVSEWKFYCSQEQHNKLAKEFKDGITKKNNPSVREHRNPQRKRK